MEGEMESKQETTSSEPERKTEFKQKHVSKTVSYLMPKPEVSFAEVIGHEAAKEEMLDMVRAIENPEEVKKLGAHLRRGMVLHGNPGVGKTMLAKALAHACKCQFLFMSAASLRSHAIELREEEEAGSDDDASNIHAGADIDEEGEASRPMAYPYRVGMNMRKRPTHVNNIKTLFAEARAAAPAVIFIDEFDLLAARAENKAQLLIELDGFYGSKEDQVIVIAATNRLRTIDPILLRAGRFDRIVKLRNPSEKERNLLLQHYTKTKPLAQDVNLKEWALFTAGYSGAQLESMCNEAALEAFSRRQKEIDANAFHLVFEREALGYKDTVARRPEEEKRCAYHEAGHTVLAMVLGTQQILKVTIVPHEKSEGVVFMALEEGFSRTKSYLDNVMCQLFGGLAGEVLGLGQHATGCGSDLHKIENLFDSMVRKGMIRDLLCWKGENDRQDCDRHRIIRHRYCRSLLRRTFDLLHRHRAFLEEVATQLIKHKTLNRAHLLEIAARSNGSKKGVEIKRV